MKPNLNIAKRGAHAFVGKPIVFDKPADRITNAGSRQPLKLSDYQSTPQRPNSCTKHILSHGVRC